MTGRSDEATGEADQLERAGRYSHSFARLAVGRIPAIADQAQAAPENPSLLRQAAQAGARAPTGRLPYADRLQKLFGRHDLGGVQAHQGPTAATSAAQLNAAAYTMGNHVVFAGPASLHVVAHEAAHVVQQRFGVRLPGGLSQIGDPYERHADAVADRVVAGQPVEELLDRLVPPGSLRA